MTKRMHLAFDLSYIHMDGRWRMPGAWPGRIYLDVSAFEEIAWLAERGLLDMLFSGDGTGVPSTRRGNRDAGFVRELVAMLGAHAEPLRRVIA